MNQLSPDALVRYRAAASGVCARGTLTEKEDLGSNRCVTTHQLGTLDAPLDFSMIQCFTVK